MSSSTKVFLFVILNVSISTGLRFFKTRKRKKECPVSDGWTFHNVTCSTKYQKCCNTGCCDRSNYDASTTYVRVIIVCGLIVFIVGYVYMEMWCKRKWNLFKNNQRSRNNVEQNEKTDEENCEEMRVFCSFTYDYDSDKSQDENRNEGIAASTIDNCTPPPAYVDIDNDCLFHGNEHTLSSKEQVQ